MPSGIINPAFRIATGDVLEFVAVTFVYEAKQNVYEALQRRLFGVLQR